MAKPVVAASQQKLAERITILHDRGTGLLTRLYNIKKMLQRPDSRLAVLNDKSLEPVLRTIVKKFPNIDSRSITNQNVLAQLNRIESFQAVKLYYETFADILEFKNEVCELLATIDASCVHFNLLVCYELTKGYFELISTYVSTMILLSKVDDRKTIIGLYNLVHELKYGKYEESYHRLGQMVIDYDPPLRKLMEEFHPHARLLSAALRSLQEVYKQRNRSAQEWRKSQHLSLVSDPPKMLSPSQHETECIACEFLPLSEMERWLIFSYMVCPQQLDRAAMDLWKMALTNNYVTTLFRDEVISTHSYIQGFFENIKGYSKRVSELKEFHAVAVQNAPRFHRDRRMFLRSALREMVLVLSDQPGLLGPKIVDLFKGLSLARDEIDWYLRHLDNLPEKKKGGASKHVVSADEFMDRMLPELMYYMEELRGLVKKYQPIIQRYYIQFMSEFDAVALSQAIQSVGVCPEEELVILSETYQTLVSLNDNQVENRELFDFKGIRLDWYRFQAYTCIERGGLQLMENAFIASAMNQVVFHTRMLDWLDEMLRETSDLSIFYFYVGFLEEQFHSCKRIPAQQRFIVVFLQICSHFMNATHELCPEERQSIGNASVQYAHWFLKETCELLVKVVLQICHTQAKLADQLLPKHAVDTLASHMKKRVKDKKNRDIKDQRSETGRPGDESMRKQRENLTDEDKSHMGMTELGFALNHYDEIVVWEFKFLPREFFATQLELRFNRALMELCMFTPETLTIAKPTEMLAYVNAYMSVLQTLENYIQIDITKIFTNVFPNQAMERDCNSGDDTVVTKYAKWYLDILLRRVTAGTIVYSETRQAFVSLAVDQQLPASAEEYADIMELRALCQLVGPFGVKLFNERIIKHVAGQVKVLKQIVVDEMKLLEQIRYKFSQAEVMKSLVERLSSVDVVIQRMTIIGILFSFRHLLDSALHSILEERVPFLLSSIKGFYKFVCQENVDPNNRMVAFELAGSAGIPVEVDPILCASLRMQSRDIMHDDNMISCLLFVYVAVALPTLARNERSAFKPSLEACVNNSHCIARAVNELSAAIFTIPTLPGKTTLVDIMQEFLALLSSSLLRLGTGEHNEKEAAAVTKHKDSVCHILRKIIIDCPVLNQDQLEHCYPYVLMRDSYRSLYRSTSD